MDKKEGRKETRATDEYIYLYVCEMNNKIRGVEKCKQPRYYIYTSYITDRPKTTLTLLTRIYITLFHLLIINYI